MPGGRPTKADNAESDAKRAAKDKIIDATRRIQDGMFCKHHNRLCYDKYDGTCGAYTPDHILEHAERLVSFL